MAALGALRDSKCDLEEHEEGHLADDEQWVREALIDLCRTIAEDDDAKQGIVYVGTECK